MKIFPSARAIKLSEGGSSDVQIKGGRSRREIGCSIQGYDFRIQELET